MEKLRSSWARAWQAIGGPVDEPLFERLIAAWSEAHRHYHTLQHLCECIDHLDGAATLAARPAEVELALWFHDAVYDPRRDDNETRSAAWARQAALDASAPPGVAGRLHDLVEVTRHDARPETDDERVLVDIDLAILGATDHRFDEYERQVRAEYAWVPEADFRRRRGDLLAGFLARSAIYGTPHFHDLLETRARANLARAIARRQP
jgi:predicted metal-dependent HD superfamily phosphohydrolase